MTYSSGGGVNWTVQSITATAGASGSPGSEAGTSGCATSGSSSTCRVEVIAHLPTFELSNESAVAIGGATLLLWAVAFVLRTARKLLETEESE
jgi:hypothetical protein